MIPTLFDVPVKTAAADTADLAQDAKGGLRKFKSELKQKEAGVRTQVLSGAELAKRIGGSGKSRSAADAALARAEEIKKRLGGPKVACWATEYVKAAGLPGRIIGHGLTGGIDPVGAIGANTGMTEAMDENGLTLEERAKIEDELGIGSGLAAGLGSNLGGTAGLLGGGLAGAGLGAGATALVNHGRPTVPGVVVGGLAGAIPGMFAGQYYGGKAVGDAMTRREINNQGF